MNTKTIGILAMLLLATVAIAGCTNGPSEPESTSGVSKATTTIKPGSDGYTVEQRNIVNRLQQDNKQGSIKYLYIMSAYSGQVLLFSTVNGKVTSSGKRLSPYSAKQYNNDCSFQFNVNGYRACTNEVLQDDGTYGSSIEYLYWFDANGQYFQYYVTGGAIPVVSSAPIAVKDIVMNLEVQTQH